MPLKFDRNKSKSKSLTSGHTASFILEWENVTMKDKDLQFYFVVTKPINMLEYATFVRIINNLLNDQEEFIFISKNDMKYYAKLMRNVDHAGLRNYIFDTIELTCSGYAKKTFLKVIEEDQKCNEEDIPQILELMKLESDYDAHINEGKIE